MPVGSAADNREFRRLLGRAVQWPLALLTLLTIALVGQVLYLRDLQRWVDHTDLVIGQAHLVQRHFLDAETGMRGFLLNQEEHFLEPYHAAERDTVAALQRLESLIMENPSQVHRVRDLEARWDAWFQLAELRITNQREGHAPTREQAERGKSAMDALRGIVADLLREEEELRVDRVNEADTWSWILLTLTGIGALSTGGVIAVRGRRQLLGLSGRYEDLLSAQLEQTRALTEKEWLTRSRAELATRVQGDLPEGETATEILAHLATATGANLGLLYGLNAEARRLHLEATYGAEASGEARPPEVIPLGQGLLGQAAVDGRIIRVEVPSDHVRITSASGESRPRHLVVAPLSASGRTIAAVELAFSSEPREATIALLETLGDAAAAALASAHYRAHLARLLAATEAQAAELTTQQEELRVSNEELQRQSEELARSQAQLEAQQQELETSNRQLVEHTKNLERTRATLVEKADLLARANEYKSEFLANMSHELRTPLNSALILAKLLADNKHGNLTPEQVKFAETIHAAGSDLLELINDILDLSRIEAGRLDLEIERVHLADLTTSLERTFEPLAAEKGLAFTTVIDPDATPDLRTDAQRVQQILKNLISNAIKFTERGSVTLRIAPSGRDRLAFAVQDTGIGIPKDKQDLIFEAFRQVDGSTQRQYRGTGLGLTISRDLARRLGGEIYVDSTPGEGSTFSLVLPLVPPESVDTPLPKVPLPARSVSERTPSRARRERPETRPLERPPARAPETRPVPRAEAPAPKDDREALAPGSRTILVVEDDPRFAAILYDVAHEQDFRCLIAANGTDGFTLAKEHKPRAIVLDVNLPDESGLLVLERLKHDPDTRHIPVHVVSVLDYSRRALEMGAIGYALKPVQRDELVEAFRRLGARSEQQTGRVLVVEDTEIQRESLKQLLGSDSVTIESASTAKEALDHLRQATYDCMVLDLGLPDMSGYELLEKMSADPAFSFPPVIVYTGRALGPEEEVRLRKYSSSVVIKGARSPERLLDEVTLFLHRVESSLPREQQRMLREARNREAVFEARHILLVEDDVRNIFALTSVLEPKGAAIAVARNGREALEALERAPRAGEDGAIDLVLMDLMMPEMDGLTAIREIRRRPEWKKLPVIALTAKAMPEDREKCLDAGASDYIAKPIDVPKLLSLLRVWMPK